MMPMTPLFGLLAGFCHLLVSSAFTLLPLARDPRRSWPANAAVRRPSGTALSAEGVRKKRRHRKGPAISPSSPRYLLTQQGRRAMSKDRSLLVKSEIHRVRRALREQRAAKLDSSSSLQDPSQNAPSLPSLEERSAPERLQKVISRAGIASRRAAEEMILDGRVRVNGVVVTDLGVKVDALGDRVTVDGRKIAVRPPEEIKWIAVHKPKGYICSMNDDRDRKTVKDLVPMAERLRLLPVGRLDRDSSGLLLLTNDNKWLHPLTHPSYGHQKRYIVTVDNGTPKYDVLNELAEGVLLPGERTKTAPVSIGVFFEPKTSRKSFGTLEVTLREGRNRQLRRMMEFIGHPVLNIRRVDFGPLTLKGITTPGQWRELKPSEVFMLKRAVITRAKARERMLRKQRKDGETQTVAAKEISGLVDGNRRAD
ncbi:unnamed protein product [Vitrella brassicaformis CCMP3155]|uniref:RNA-binding S4 domain-containing protein n=1 Tax=Vitrella brassicaformis (strain CCMP3155) TaxID=1169540 RepID=A0A0G4ETA8_VITBC|nr:unnamed protein product [Vitrella brassicaformis CCMP3155]|eukprot:CEM01544.1 unnamed protein product [Vitrella brassicaformis CCMP3155]